MGEEQALCPSCQRPIEKKDERFCSWCRFPVMKIAGKYRLLKKLGEGGVGEVYLAEHIAISRDEERVIKFIKQEFLSTESVIKRFRREMEVTSMLSRRNQHIVQIYDDFGEVPGFGFFYVMEHVEGKTLRSELQARKRLPGERAFHIFQQLCEALAVVHQEGVIHRDLKPENILLTRRGDDDDFVKVIDFGLTKSLDGTVNTALTQGGVGTPAYMSPEQCANQPIDARTDIYAMGIILYELITGRQPFDLSAQNSGQLAAFAAHMMQQPIPMRSRAPHLRIAESLDQVVLRALAKAPADRYPSTEAFWQALALFEGDIRKDVSLDALRALADDDEGALYQAADSSQLSAATEERPLPSGILDAYRTAGLGEDDAEARLILPSGIQQSGETVVEAPAIGEMTTLPVTYSQEQAQRPHKSPLLMLGAGFVLAGLLFGGLGLWWSQRGVQSGGSRAMQPPHSQTDKAPPTRQTRAATRTPTPDAGPLPTKAAPRARATPRPGTKATPQSRVAPRRRPLQARQRTPTRRSPRRSVYAVMGRRKKPRRQPKKTRRRRRAGLTAYERSKAYRDARRVLKEYYQKPKDSRLAFALEAQIAIMKGLDKANAQERKRIRAYRRVISLHRSARRIIRHHAKAYRHDASHAQYMLGWIEAGKLAQMSAAHAEFHEHKRRMLRLFRETSRVSAMLHKVLQIRGEGRVIICSLVTNGDIHFRVLKEAEHSRDNIPTDATPLEKRQWKRRMNGKMHRVWRRAHDLYYRATRVARRHRGAKGRRCASHASQQLRQLRRFRGLRRRF